MDKKKLENQTEQVVFSASVEFNSDYIKKYGSDNDSNHLKLDKLYSFGDKKISGKEIAKVLTEALDYELFPELKKQDIPIFKVESIGISEGCIVIPFLVKTVASAVITEIIKRIAEALLTRKLREHCGSNFFVVNVNNTSTNFNNVGEIKRDRTHLLLISYLVFSNIALIAMLFYLLLRRYN